MSILDKMNKLKKTTATDAKTPMSDQNILNCKAALKRDNRGYNVHPNSFDINTPYRVAINYDNKWHNFGNFVSADVAAAVGSIVSAGFFGDKAKAGDFDSKIVESDEAFATWMADDRNADIIARANGDLPPVHGSTAGATTSTVQEEQPF